MEGGCCRAGEPGAQRTLTFSTGEWDRPAPMPMTPQVRTPPRPWVEKQEPNTDSILSSRIMQDSSRHRLDMAAGAQREGRQAGQMRWVSVSKGREAVPGLPKGSLD